LNNIKLFFRSKPGFTYLQFLVHKTYMLKLGKDVEDKVNKIKTYYLLKVKRAEAQYYRGLSQSEYTLKLHTPFQYA
jgi:hypothetical protein